MPNTPSRAKTTIQSYDPLEPLVTAIGLMLAENVGKTQAQPSALSFHVSQALHQVLESPTPQSRSTRMLLIRHLVDIESQQIGISIPDNQAVAGDLISTAQAAEILGYSRPYVAMLIDQNQLKGATVSAGGHRRVPRAAVLAWKAKHLVKDKVTGLRTEGQKIGAYKSTEVDAARRVKALASTPK
ncbi:MAG: excisionase family DNA-binding protein [Rhodoferax sp.]|nr:excisionase family DNA-binding protein [Rhodoferax sp.]MDP3654128.1 excisionase family DNA-binding protein [Rhodoferax sp.]